MQWHVARGRVQGPSSTDLGEDREDEARVVIAVRIDANVVDAPLADIASVADVSRNLLIADPGANPVPAVQPAREVRGR